MNHAPIQKEKWWGLTNGGFLCTVLDSGYDDGIALGSIRLGKGSEYGAGWHTETGQLLAQFCGVFGEQLAARLKLVETTQPEPKPFVMPSWRARLLRWLRKGR